MENIKNFKKVKYYQGEKELTEEEVKSLGMTSPDYMSLDECAYQTAYDLSEDWSKQPTWEMVQEAYKLGTTDGMKYAMNRLEPQINELLGIINKYVLA